MSPWLLFAGVFATGQAYGAWRDTDPLQAGAIALLFFLFAFVLDISPLGRRR